jgi:hypothetical protein
LRLLDVSLTNNAPANLDTEFFPTDNPNPNHTGAVTFGPNRVYALDSNNGLIAMTLTLSCVPTQLGISRSGSNVVLTWGRSDYRLQGSTSLASPTAWSDIPGSSPVTNPIGGGFKYYRLVCP